MGPKNSKEPNVYLIILLILYNFCKNKPTVPKPSSLKNKHSKKSRPTPIVTFNFDYQL